MRSHAKAAFAAIAALALFLAFVPAAGAAPPRIESLFTTGVTETSAVLHARINPEGEATKYRFEYGTTVAYGNTVPVPAGDISAGPTTQEVIESIAGLTGVTYHFRVVASSAAGTSTSEDQTFEFFPPSCPNSTVRQQVNSAYLPDCRAYELVSPENAQGTFFQPGGPYSPYASSPPRLAYIGELGNATGENVINNNGDLYVSTRGSQGWTTRYVGLGGDKAACVGGPPSTNYQASPDKGHNGVLTDRSMERILMWNGGNPLACISNQEGQFDGNTAAEASNAPYVFRADGTLLDRWPTSLDSFPGAAAAFACPQNLSEPVLPPAAGCTTNIAASGDLKRFAFSTASGVFGAGGITTAPGSAYVNDVEDGTLTLISLTPAGTPIGQEPGNSDPKELIQFPGMSADGSHVLMATDTAPRCTPDYDEGRCRSFLNPVHLYMWVEGAPNTYDVSSSKAANYVDMTPDGSKVYFTSTDQLTVDDHDTSRDLFMWRLAADGTTSLLRLSGGSGGTGDTDTCSAGWTTQCGVVAYSDEGYSQASSNRGGRGILAGKGTDNAVATETGEIYFYSPEQLDGQKGIPNAWNFYVFRNGHPQYVETFSGNVTCLENVESLSMPSVTCSDGPVARLQVSPDGEHAAFVTANQLTSYNNAGRTEMYTYNPVTEKVRCVSCLPSGQPPTTDVLASQGGLFMSNDGRTFFSTEDPLVPQDTNEGYDVYEFVDGRAQLITAGTGKTAEGHLHLRFSQPGLYGVSADGTDVYFSTYDILVPQDRNGNELKFYDARTNGGFPVNPPLLPCAAADECHATLSEAPGQLQRGTSVHLGDGGNVAHKQRKQRQRSRSKHRKHKEKKRPARSRRHGRFNHHMQGGIR